MSSVTAAIATSVAIVVYAEENREAARLLERIAELNPNLKRSAIEPAAEP
jgi:hypothetical protein